MQDDETKYHMLKCIKQNSLFKNSCVISVIICLIAHAYAYFNASFFHDRSQAVYPGKWNSASRARWMQQFINLLTAFDYLPWLCGVLAIAFFALSIYMIADILEIRSVWNLCLIAGICITNDSVINAHLYWVPEILVALPFALASAWIWKMEDKRIAIRVSFGAFFVGLSLASYGAYTSAAPCIVIISLFFELLDNRKWLKVLRRGMEYAMTFAIGMAFYYIVLRLFLHFQELSLTAYMGRNRLVSDFPNLKEILELVKQAWYSALIYLKGEKDIRLILALSICILMVQFMRQKKKECRFMCFLMMLLLMALFPLCAGLIHVMAFGSVHWLMKFSYIMPYIFIITLLDREQEMHQGERKKDGKIVWGMAAVVLVIVSGTFLNDIDGRIRLICLGIMACAGLYSAYLFLLNRLKSNGNTENEMCGYCETVPERSTLIAWCAVLTILISLKMYTGILNANIAYMKCDEIDRATRSFTTRLLGRIEGCEGFEGNEVIVFIGDVNKNAYISATNLMADNKWDYLSDDIFVSRLKNGITYNHALCGLLKTDAGCTLSCKLLSSEDYSPQEQNIIGEMPDYPADGSIRKVDESIIVKLSDE